ncbi:MAG TPA: phenylalanine--tRNA ligase subunit beta [Methylomirabilota bacterium]|jgi:phenylalanyl-tRNA synthetase beta chain
MKISYAWVKEFADLALSAHDAADRLVNGGIEVAAVTPLAPPDLRGVVIGEIEAIERTLGESQGHRLVLCRVSTGGRRFAVVCGAPNAAPGVRAAFAPPGAVLPGGRRIAAAAIRGAESQGMLCSERELGLGDEHDAGILAVDPEAPLGADLVTYLGLDDFVLEIEITPNRPDCLSVVGVARELAALTGSRFRPPAVTLKEADEPVESLAAVHVEAPDLCPRYTARVISGVTVGPSPAWMAARLRAAGLRPISNVVDITNYVLWELGHPLHAFDHATVAGGTIVVRRARKRERITTLDGQERTLTEAMLVIADRRHAIGLAGVMGGGSTEVTTNTTRVLLEAAYFDPATTRRTARALGLTTDAAYRFERGADIGALLDASARAAQLMVDLAGGRVARGVIDVYPSPRPRPRIRLRMERVQRLIGSAPSREEAARILGSLGLAVRDSRAGLDVEVPSFRRDLAMEDDLVEEVIRVWGYDKIPSTLPGGALSLVTIPPALRQEATVRRALVGAGLHEVISYSFADPSRDALLGDADVDKPLPLLNPLSQDASIMRRHVLDGVLDAIATNVRRQQPDVHVFEIGKAYGQSRTDVRERRWVVAAVTGARARAWDTPAAAVDVFDAKGLAEHVLAALGVRHPRTVPGRARQVFEPDCDGALDVDEEVVAEFGEVRAEIRERWGIAAPVFAALLPLDVLAAIAPAPARYQPLPRFPSVHRDMAFTVGESALVAADVEAAIRAEAGPLLRHLTLFDVFRLPDGRRSLAWRLTFQAEDRTLTDDEVNAIHARVAARVSERFHVTLRGTG